MNNLYDNYHSLLLIKDNILKVGEWTITNKFYYRPIFTIIAHLLMLLIGALNALWLCLCVFWLII